MDSVGLVAKDDTEVTVLSLGVIEGGVIGWAGVPGVPNKSKSNIRN